MARYLATITKVWHLMVDANKEEEAIALADEVYYEGILVNTQIDTDEITGDTTGQFVKTQKVEH